MTSTSGLTAGYRMLAFASPIAHPMAPRAARNPPRASPNDLFPHTDHPVTERLRRHSRPEKTQGPLEIRNSTGTAISNAQVTIRLR
ncbi:MAG: hypothetical protein ACREA0_00110 [bacterium]